MAQWQYAEYREFHHYPREMVCANDRGTFFFISRYDKESDDYSDYYEVYRINPVSDSEVCSSWFGLETQALARLPDLPITKFPFDTRKRIFLEYDPIIQHLLE